MDSDYKLSLVTPMYNEAEHIVGNIEKILKAMDGLNIPWEYILVDDGSTDRSLSLAQNALAGKENCAIIHYPQNRGRGYALRQGFDAASGEYIITTESDLSWGEEIIDRLFSELENTEADIVVASVHACGGDMENVPFWRMALSRYSNVIMRWMFGNSLTMLSGMTRGYRREAIKSLYLEQNRKEIHLEIILKAQLMGMRIKDIPATIKWKCSKQEAKKRGSGLSILKFILPHLQISLLRGATRILLCIWLLLSILSGVFITVGGMNKIFQFWPGMIPNLVTYGLLLLLMAVTIGSVLIIGNQLRFLYMSIVHLQAKNQEILCSLKNTVYN